MLIQFNDLYIKLPWHSPFSVLIRHSELLIKGIHRLRIYIATHWIAIKRAVIWVLGLIILTLLWSSVFAVLGNDSENLYSELMKSFSGKSLEIALDIGLPITAWSAAVLDVALSANDRSTRNTLSVFIGSTLICMVFAVILVVGHMAVEQQALQHGEFWLRNFILIGFLTSLTTIKHFDFNR